MTLDPKNVGRVLVGVRNYSWITAGNRYRVVRLKPDAYETENGICITPLCFEDGIVRWEDN